MAHKEKVFEYIEIDDRTPVQKLSIGDQLRVLFKRLAYDPGQELKRDDALTREELKLKANLSEFVFLSTEPIRRGKKRSVTMSISSKFDSVFDEVFNSPKITNNYNVEIIRPNIEYNITYFINVTMEVK